MAKRPKPEERYQELRRRVFDTYRLNPIKGFYLVVKDNPKQYQKLNDPKTYTPEVLIHSTAKGYNDLIAIFSHFYLVMHSQSDLFFESSSSLKFLAQEFPIIYLKLFIYVADKAQNSRKFKPREVNDIPYLRKAYRNIPAKFKKTFDAKLLKYYRAVREWD